MLLVHEALSWDILTPLPQEELRRPQQLWTLLVYEALSY
jgi:hypothetical protein